MQQETHRQSIIMDVSGGDELVAADDVTQLVRVVEIEINEGKRSGSFKLSSGKTVTWSYEQPVH